ncbi:MAG: hypothetical protein M9962_08500 [Oligoflexia bacterium]|nr:hypothetical protein [Oligoflexia bacterium]
MKKILQFSIFVAIASSVSLTTYAFDQKYYDLSDAVITEEAPTAEDIYSSMIEPKAIETLSPSDLAAVDWNQIILIGQKIIEIIKANAPVVNIKRDAVSALPLGITDWQTLNGWQLPVTKVYRVRMQNAYGMDMVNIRLKVSAMHGGSLNSKGKYLANVIIVPTEINVKWGITLNLWSENREPVNMNTSENPIAGLGFDVRYQAKSWVTEINGTKDYFVTGEGQIHEP